LIQDTQVIVKDTATPTDPDILPQLFSTFASKSFEVTGLGLFISKSIIEAHGGKIWKYGEGTILILMEGWVQHFTLLYH
jgi:signal transduction histidine kinase